MFSSRDYHTPCNTWEDRIIKTYGNVFLRKNITYGNVAVIGPSDGRELHDLRKVLHEDITLYGFEMNPVMAQYAADHAPANTLIFNADGYALSSHPYLLKNNVFFSAIFFNNNLLPAMRDGLKEDSLTRVVESIEYVADDVSKLFVAGNSTHVAVELFPARRIVGRPVVYEGTAYACVDRLLTSLGIAERDFDLRKERDPQQNYMLAK